MLSANAALASSYDYHEVARSAIIAVAASYVGLDLAGRVTAAMGRARLAWLGGGATAMGIGIWAMHMKGMLAFHLPVPVEYHWPTLFVALLVAIFASSIALYVASRQKMGRVEALTGCVFLGGGIVGLHYLCMAAMRLPAITRFSPLLGSIFGFVRHLVFSNGVVDGIRSERGNQMERSAKAWQRHADGSRYLGHALHRHGCRNFYSWPASGAFPRREHLSRWQLWSCHCDLDSAGGRDYHIVGGQAGPRRNSGAQPGLGAARRRANLAA